jgi:hypothetical protein
MGNQQTTMHEPNPIPEPKKSALQRSSSISETNAFLPPYKDDGRLMRPTVYEEHSSFPRTAPYDGSDVSSGNYGTDSPQWGWYTHHTTPPTPEYYYGRSSRTQGTSNSRISSQKASTTHGSDMSSSTVETPIPVAPQPNPVFRILQNKYKANPNAWNVPC